MNANVFHVMNLLKINSISCLTALNLNDSHADQLIRKNNVKCNCNMTDRPPGILCMVYR